MQQNFPSTNDSQPSHLDMKSTFTTCKAPSWAPYYDYESTVYKADTYSNVTVTALKIVIQ